MDWLYYSVVGAYIALQALALWLMRGRWRLAAWVPVAIMAVAVAVGAVGWLAGSDIAPMWILIAMPACIGWLAVLFGIWGAGRAIDRK